MNFVSAALIGRGSSAGLYCETAKGSFWIWTDKAGNITREVNCTPVDDFPKTAKKALQMEQYFLALKADILAYLNTQAGTKLYWEIRRVVEAI